MGTNFYILNDDGSEGRHVGKRSAAGWYCWDCGTTLCKDGSRGVHQGNNEWYDSCPECHKAKADEPIEDSTAFRELGFNKTTPRYKSGVASCSSFTWAYAPKAFHDRWDCFVQKIIINEYGDKFTYDEFIEILSECPIQSTLVGQDFC